MAPRPIDDVPLPDERTIEEVRASCADLGDSPTILAERFYWHLFDLVPEIRSMFGADMTRQHERMADVLLQVVTHLDQPHEVADYLRQLGAHHHQMLGVKPDHYPFVGRAMVRAIRDLSPVWSSSFSSSWILVYEWIAATMLAGARARAQQMAEGGATESTARHKRPARSL
ncbi:globin domain-containing protein [Nocardiopsis ansamitocini]|uniref:Globin domain-containing protein n=1 Tax=Nocardiopsis ansamitocini TaxID=1670832 RepID=A0A9W6UJZ3_9ACTN|nr:globin domain-containing protein [Nocardiopsis ansamitocini]GLU48560.1 hypothetical protein Nans01_29110 [Nocardiopsis ansamitocini]